MDTRHRDRFRQTRHPVRGAGRGARGAGREGAAHEPVEGCSTIEAERAERLRRLRADWPAAADDQAPR